MTGGCRRVPICLADSFRSAFEFVHCPCPCCACRAFLTALRVVNAGHLSTSLTSFQVPKQARNFKCHVSAESPGCLPHTYRARVQSQQWSLSSAEAFLGIADFHFIAHPVEFYSDANVRSSACLQHSSYLFELTSRSLKEQQVQQLENFCRH